MSLINIAQRDKDGKKEPTRFYSQKQENDLAKHFEGERVKKSGAKK